MFSHIHTLCKNGVELKTKEEIYLAVFLECFFLRGENSKKPPVICSIPFILPYYVVNLLVSFIGHIYAESCVHSGIRVEWRSFIIVEAV